MYHVSWKKKHFMERFQVRHMWVEPSLRGRGWMQRGSVPELQVCKFHPNMFSTFAPRYDGAPKPAGDEALELLQSECPHLYDELTATGEVLSSNYASFFAP